MRKVSCICWTTSICRRLRPTNFRISAEHNYMKVLNYCDLLLLSYLENASIMRREVSTNLGPVSREVNTFRAYYGCHKSRPIFKMTTFHFKSSNFTINPFFSHLKHVARPHFRMSFLIGSLSRQPLQRPMRLAQKTIDPFKKTKQNKKLSCVLSWSNKIRACKTAMW